MKRILFEGNQGSGLTTIEKILFPQFINIEKNCCFGLNDDCNKNFLQTFTLIRFKLTQNWQVNKLHDKILQKISALVYVFDISQNNSKRLLSLQKWTYLMKKLSSSKQNIPIYILFHKKDLVNFNYQQRLKEILKQIEKSIENSSQLKIEQYFQTSIYDSSFYQAWSKILQKLNPDQNRAVKLMNQIICENKIENIVIFDSESVLCVCENSSTQSKQQSTQNQFLSYIIKKFRYCTKKYGYVMKDLRIKSQSFNLKIYQQKPFLIALRSIQTLS